MSLSAAPSKFGVDAKARTPVDVFSVKSAASVPEIDQVRVVGVSTSDPANVATAEIPSACVSAYVALEEFVVITGASFVLVIVIVAV